MFILDQFNRRWVISSFGGETPVNTVGVSGSGVGTIYTVPSGKYFKGVLYIGSSAGGATDINIGGAEILSPVSTNTQIEIIAHSGEAITQGGSVGASDVYLRGLLYNNP